MFNWGLLDWDHNLEAVNWRKYSQNQGCFIPPWVKTAARRQCTSHDERTLGIFVSGPSSSHMQVGVVSLHSSVHGDISFAAWDQTVMLLTGISPVSRQGMPLDPTEWQNSLYFASGNLPLEHFAEIWCIRRKRNLRRVDCRFSFASKLSIQQNVCTVYI